VYPEHRHHGRWFVAAARPRDPHVVKSAAFAAGTRQCFTVASLRDWNDARIPAVLCLLSLPLYCQWQAARRIAVVHAHRYRERSH